ncbi:sentrin-specific protease 7 isoform X3 [Xyrichtys novacula]|uniref:Sentrin-specific protease 7 isoform X3 n=1 Tax=Xyrichtys novacula TaxID=13765 RepID=A0AAV1H3N9_XYRNO|nr:sentrin-specific protease 7 isoform X3 [Xyrichtys novacula]
MMMERRKALTIPFTLNKDNRVSWTAFAGCKIKQCDSLHKNGSKLFDHHLAIMERRKPFVILEDVLKTEKGRDFIERRKQSRMMGNRRHLSNTQKESGQSREEPLTCREPRSSQTPDVKAGRNKTATLKRNLKTPSSSSPRQRTRKRLQDSFEEEDIEEHKDIKEVIIGKDIEEDDKFAGVVDCGFSVSWERAEDTGSCDEFSPERIKDRLSDPEKEVQHGVRRKRKEVPSQCNGTSSPKRHRESVLRLTGESRGSTQISLEEESEVNTDIDGFDHTIVQFTVGGDDPTEVLLPNLSPHLESGDVHSTTGQDNTAQTSPSEPIVLSSDDEEGSEVPVRCIQELDRPSPVVDPVIERQTSEETFEVMSVIVEDLPGLVSVIPPVDCLLNVPFSTLHCGGLKGKSNGDMMIKAEKIIIPLTDPSEKVEVVLSYQRKELGRFSIWMQDDMKAQGLHFKDDKDPFPAAVLMLFVSESAAAGIQQDLLQLCAKQDRNTNTEKASPFILLTFREPPERMVAALLRSNLQIDCLLEAEPMVPFGAEDITGLEDNVDPDLNLADSLTLIRRTSQDSHLLSLLGLENASPGPSTDQDGSSSDTNEDTAPLIQQEDMSQKELEKETDRDSGTQLKPEEEHKEQEPEPPSEKKKEEPTPVYTVCHRRTKGSYSVSLCRPDPSWTKYKHQGLAHRLIQFPPPPLKGGITVTMEDLQCLDSGQFLNDVIIDFYLKYLLQNASEAVAERCHIFSSFFYKQLTRRDNASEGITNDTCQRQRRHQRVKTWTRHVDIFKKDFLFVPVNQEAHWYLVVICFPGLMEPKSEAWMSSNSENGKSNDAAGEVPDQEVAQGSKSPNESTEKNPTLEKSDSADTEMEKAGEKAKDPPPGPVTCTEKTCKATVVCKRPCILIMDSLKLSLHERVFKLLRDYLQSEWEVRRGSSRDFSTDQMQSSHCQVPLQDNSSDCGLYLLQYVESFLKDPVVHFDLPLYLQRWFPRQQVRRKRDEIRDLVLHLYRKQNS